MSEVSTFDPEWVVLELMGHRRLFGLLQSTSFPGGLYRIDVYPGEVKKPAMTQYYNPSAVYCITPTDEASAREMADRATPPAAQLQLMPVTDYGEEDYRDPDDEDY